MQKNIAVRQYRDFQDTEQLFSATRPQSLPQTDRDIPFNLS
jgi:hypothetical protein